MLRKFTHNERGAFDLPSVMVAIVVTTILVAVAGVSFVLVIPWYQDSAAKDKAQALVIAQTNRPVYATQSELVAEKAAVIDSSMCMAVSTDRQRYSAAVKSSSGDIYVVTNTNTTPTKATGQTCFNTGFTA